MSYAEDRPVIELVFKTLIYGCVGGGLVTCCEPVLIVSGIFGEIKQQKMANQSITHTLTSGSTKMKFCMVLRAVGSFYRKSMT